MSCSTPEEREYNNRIVFATQVLIPEMIITSNVLIYPEPERAVFETSDIFKRMEQHFKLKGEAPSVDSAK